MIVQDDSPAVQELQDEEMEVEVEVDGKTAHSANKTGNSICSFLVVWWLKQIYLNPPRWAENTGTTYVIDIELIIKTWCHRRL